MKHFKKALRYLSAFVMCGALLAAGAAPAAAETVDPDGLVLYVGQNHMINGDTRVSLEDSAPVMHNGHVYVPLRAVAEGFGADVEYNKSTGDIVVSQGDREVVLNMKASIFSVDGMLKWMDMAPYINQAERTMVPVRCISDGLGYEIDIAHDDNGNISALYINHVSEKAE